MVAAVETMMFSKAGGVPWHGLGKPIEESDRYSIAACIDHSGLNWGVDLEPLFLERVDDKGNKRYIDVKAFRQAVVRDSDKKILGTVGPRYTPLQNQEAFDWFQPLLDDKLCRLDTAGSLEDGTKVWVLAQIDSTPLEIAKGDEILRYLLLSNSHDGTTSVRVGLTPIRVVCANTLAMAHNNASSKLLRLRHQKSLHENLDKVRDIINLANNEFEATAEQYRFLASKRIVHSGDLKKYVKIMAGFEDTPDSDMSTKGNNIIERILTNIVGGRGQDNPAIKGTWWQAMNGVNEYMVWERGRTVSSRLDSMWFGQGFNDNAKALKLAMDFAQGTIAA